MQISPQTCDITIVLCIGYFSLRTLKGVPHTHHTHTPTHSPHHHHVPWEKQSNTGTVLTRPQARIALAFWLWTRRPTGDFCSQHTRRNCINMWLNIRLTWANCPAKDLRHTWPRVPGSSSHTPDLSYHHTKYALGKKAQHQNYANPKINCDPYSSKVISNTIVFSVHMRQAI